MIIKLQPCDFNSTTFQHNSLLDENLKTNLKCSHWMLRWYIIDIFDKIYQDKLISALTKDDFEDLVRKYNETAHSNCSQRPSLSKMKSSYNGSIYLHEIFLSAWFTAIS